ncbi:hypothetical protein BKA69DRAFT_1178960 [Paraphysoderma sedebokerense]|nr:hypothetical protein BKA69DRAFT_1178960 [Paraphysoderma sedebokerense]
MSFAKLTALCLLALSTVAVSVPFKAGQNSTHGTQYPEPVTPAKVILYQDYGLQGSTKNLDAAPNQCIDINDFNDAVSSFQVYQPSGEQNCVVAYDDYGCNGPEQLLCGVGDVQRNDIISSIRFETPLIRATFYEDFTHSGRKFSSRVIPGQCTNLREINDAISSFEISNDLILKLVLSGMNITIVKENQKNSAARPISKRTTC